MRANIVDQFQTERFFSDKSTYNESVCEEGVWQYTECIKGANIYKGYIAEAHYLNMEEEKESCSAAIKQSSGNQSVWEIFKQTYEQGFSTLMQKSEDIGKREKHQPGEKKRIRQMKID